MIPQEQFYRYSDSFSRSIQQSSFIIVLSAFLKSGDVPTKEEVESELGGSEWKGRMWLSTEDYLHSLISLVNELVRTHSLSLCALLVRLMVWKMNAWQSRLAINRVIMGDYSAPVQYSQFSPAIFLSHLPFSLIDWQGERRRVDSRRNCRTLLDYWIWRTIRWGKGSIVSNTTSRNSRKVCSILSPPLFSHQSPRRTDWPLFLFWQSYTIWVYEDSWIPPQQTQR